MVVGNWIIEENWLKNLNGRKWYCRNRKKNRGKQFSYNMQIFTKIILSIDKLYFSLINAVKFKIEAKIPDRSWFCNWSRKQVTKVFGKKSEFDKSISTTGCE